MKFDPQGDEDQSHGYQKIQYQRAQRFEYPLDGMEATILHSACVKISCHVKLANGGATTSR